MARQAVLELVGDASRLVKSLNDAEGSTRTFGDKVQDAGKKMTAFATVPIVGFLGAATKAAADDAAAQSQLATVLNNVKGGGDALVATVEDQLAAFMKVSTFSDDELRPAMATLVAATGDVAESNRLMALAMDVAAAKGIPLEAATNAVAKAVNGQVGAANRLVPGLIDTTDETMNAEKATALLAETFGGSAAAATETAAGKTKMMTRDLGEMTESIGGALLPILSSLLGLIQPVIDRFSEMSEGTQKMIVFVGLAVAAIGPLIGVITALSTAMAFLAANPIVLVIGAVAALVAGLVYAYKNSETFRDIVDRAFDVVQTAISAMWRVAQPILDKLATALRWIGDNAGRILGAVSGPLSAVGGAIGKLPFLAAGGPITGPAIVGERGPELFIPGRAGTIIPNHALGGGGTVINVSVGGSVVSEQDLVDVVHNGLLRKQNRSGDLGF